MSDSIKGNVNIELNPSAGISEPSVVETPVAPTTAKPAAVDEVSSKFAALSKKEKLILKKQQEIQAKEKDIQEKYSKYQEFESLKGSARSNPLKALESLGLSYDEITDYILNDSKPTVSSEVKTVQDELAQFKKQLEEEKESVKRREEEEREKQYSSAITTFKAEITDFITENSTEYELIGAYNQSELVYNTIEEAYNRSLEEGTPKILSIKEAASMVEKYLEEEVSKVLSLNKVKSRFAPKVEEAPTPKEEPKFMPSSSASPKTLNNQITSSAPSMLPAKTETDRLRRAMAKLSGS